MKTVAVHYKLLLHDCYFSVRVFFLFLRFQLLLMEKWRQRGWKMDLFLFSLSPTSRNVQKIKKKKVSGVVCQGAVGGAQAAGEYGKWFATLCEQVFCRLAWLCVSVGTDAVVHVRIQYLLIMFSQLKFSIIIPHTIETCRKREKEMTSYRSCHEWSPSVERICNNNNNLNG